MFRVNKRLEYGVIALFYLASESRDAAFKVASVRKISKDCRIPITLLSKVMQLLKNAGIVSAVHGNQGGYTLSRPLSEINMLKLSQVLVGPIQVAECLAPGKTTCPAQPSCTIITPMTMLNQKIVALFENTSVETLLNRRGVA
ncbi:MAG: Rrf2 family transcriptional regulator [Deltaproteobacteria bacterium]|nr:Rrf2 family transcriptional regulator [Deltaproteobacteria bacterium]MBI3293492.1 Rrf2 family transcriptional regulator [Deltaproteobacteria bacterium]